MLKILHRLCFISSRLGTDTLSHHAFVYLAAVDVLLQDRTQAEEFLRDIQPAEIGQIPKHPLDRSMDRYFLITAEHFASILHTFAVKELLAPAASPYLSIDGDPKLFHIFEAAHCVMLAVLAAPHNIKYAVSQIEPYAGLLFQVGLFALDICPSSLVVDAGIPTFALTTPVPIRGQAARTHHISTFASIGAAATTRCNFARGFAYSSQTRRLSAYIRAPRSGCRWQ